MAGKPTTTDVHINTALSDISVAYKQSIDSLIAHQTFPIVPVEKQSDKLFEFDKNDWMRDEAQKRAPGTESSGNGFGITAPHTYFCEVVAHHKDLPYAVVANSDINGLPAQMAEFVTWKLLLQRERDWIANFFAASIWENDFTGTAADDTGTNVVQFNDGALSDPMKAIDRGRQAIGQNTGFRPNILVMGEQVFDELRRHPDVKETIKYTQLGVGSEELLATLFRVDKVLVPGSSYATNNEGATAAYSYNFGKDMLLCYAPASPGLLTPTAGYIFEWTGFNGLGYDVAISDIPMDHLKATRIEGEMAYDAKVIGTDLGCFYSGIIA